MPATRFLVLFLIFLYTSCEKADVPGTIPSCIKDKIQEMEKNPLSNPPAKVWQYSYRGETVYYIPPACCDQFGSVYNRKCRIICNPEGGITGQGDGRCEDFFSTRKNEKLIWEDKR